MVVSPTHIQQLFIVQDNFFGIGYKGLERPGAGSRSLGPGSGAFSVKSATAAGKKKFSISGNDNLELLFPHKMALELPITNKITLFSSYSYYIYVYCIFHIVLSFILSVL